MVRLGSVTGLPVVCGGRMLGRVEQSILTPSGKSLRGMVIRKGMGGAKWLENDQILVIGGVSVLARGPAGKLPKDADFSLTSVKDASGLRLGRVTDVFLNPETRRVTALEVSLGLVEELRHGRSLIRDFVVQPVPREPGQVLVPCGFVSSTKSSSIAAKRANTVAPAAPATPNGMI